MFEELHNENQIELDLEVLIHAIPGIVYKVTNPPDFEIQYLSSEFERLLGYNTSDFMGNLAEWKRIVYHEDLDLHDKQSESFIASSDHLVTLEYRVWKKGRKELCWIRDRIYAKRDSSDLAIELYGVMMDISEEKVNELARLEGDEKFSTFFNSINDAVFVHPLADIGFLPLEEVNDIAISRYGYSREEFLKMTAHDFTDKEEVLEHASEDFREQLLRDEQMIFQTVHVKKSGERFPVEINSNIITLKGIPYILAVSRDITERVRIQRSNIEKQETLDGIFTAAPIGIGITVNRTFKMVNEGFCSMLGYSKEELIDTSSRIIYTSDKAYEDVGKEKYSLIKKFGIGQVETVMLKKTGETIDVILSSCPINPKDLSRGVIFTSTDISNIKRTQKDLEAARLKAELSDRLKSAFLANMSHEIRTPMNAIVGFSELLDESDVIPQLKQQYTKQILKNSEQLLAIVNDILDISRIEAGEVSLKRENISLEYFLNEINDQYTALAKENDLELLTAFDCSRKKIITDPSKLKQVLDNIIINALKFTDQGFVEIGCVGTETGIEFYVKDSGVGISADSLKHVFDRFHQEENYLTKQYRGAGLGLAICKKLVELMGGEIGVESQINKGSRFWFSLPYS